MSPSVRKTVGNATADWSGSPERGEGKAYPRSSANPLHQSEPQFWPLKRLSTLTFPILMPHLPCPHVPEASSVWEAEGNNEGDGSSHTQHRSGSEFGPGARGHQWAAGAAMGRPTQAPVPARTGSAVTSCWVDQQHSEERRSRKEAGISRDTGQRTKQGGGGVRSREVQGKMRKGRRSTVMGGRARASKT